MKMFLTSDVLKQLWSRQQKPPLKYLFVCMCVWGACTDACVPFCLQLGLLDCATGYLYCMAQIVTQGRAPLQSVAPITTTGAMTIGLAPTTTHSLVILTTLSDHHLQPLPPLPPPQPPPLPPPPLPPTWWIMVEVNGVEKEMGVIAPTTTVRTGNPLSLGILWTKLLHLSLQRMHVAKVSNWTPPPIPVCMKR